MIFFLALGSARCHRKIKCLIFLLGCNGLGLGPGSKGCRKARVTDLKCLVVHHISGMQCSRKVSRGRCQDLRPADEMWRTCRDNVRQRCSYNGAPTAAFLPDRKRKRARAVLKLMSRVFLGIPGPGNSYVSQGIFAPPFSSVRSLRRGPKKRVFFGSIYDGGRIGGGGRRRRNKQQGLRRQHHRRRQHQLPMRLFLCQDSCLRSPWPPLPN